jgi:hypothetical protein
MAYLAWGSIALYFLSLAFGVWMSFSTRGGEVGGAPVLAPPVLQQGPIAVLSLFLWNRFKDLGIQWWLYPLVFLATAGFGLLLVIGAAKLKRNGPV